MYIVGVKATARLFVASVSKRKLSAHFIAMAEMVVRSAQIPSAAPSGSSNLE